MLPRRHRLTAPADYRAVLSRRGGGQARRRARAGTDLVVVHLAGANEDHAVSDAPSPHPPRIGFVVSKAVGNSVVRHRVVRRLRALMSERLSQLPEGTDLVVRALPAAGEATSTELGHALDSTLTRLVKAPT